jgi:hypothetical protein
MKLSKLFIPGSLSKLPGFILAVTLHAFDRMVHSMLKFIKAVVSESDTPGAVGIPCHQRKKAKIDRPQNPHDKTFGLYFHCFQQNRRIKNCFCQTPCNYRVVEEEQRLLAGRQALRAGAIRLSRTIRSI